MLRRHLLSTGALLALGGLVPATIGTAEARPGKKSNGLLVRSAQGTWTGAGGGSGSLTAAVLIQRLSVDPQTRTLRVHGLISSAGGNVPAFANQAFVASAVLTGGSGTGVAAQAVCQILNLDIGRITLNLLGLVIDIAPISINISAIPGGGLLGDLLCAIAGLLGGTGPLGQIQRLLGRINRILRDVLLVLGG